MLKYGRNQELEADQMGLYLMAMAGYDPRQAKPFWERMEGQSSGNRTPEFLSTHPSPETRRSDIDRHLPKALEYYKRMGEDSLLQKRYSTQKTDIENLINSLP